MNRYRVLAAIRDNLIASAFCNARHNASSPLIRFSARLAFAAVLANAVVGCATYRIYEKCGLSGCPGDAQITAAVQATLRQHAPLVPWDIDIQTLDGIIYLHGLVDTDLQRGEAEAIAAKAPGARRVVNSIGVRNPVY